MKKAEGLYRQFLSSVIEVHGLTFDCLSDEKYKDFVIGVGGFYEFTEYRKEFGARILFQYVKDSGRMPFFVERLRIYGLKSLRGIERADDPTYVNGVCESLYYRIPEGSVMLDIGCGTGKYLKVLTKRDITILAIDASTELIEENKKSDKFNHVNFYTGDCTDLHFFKGKEIDYITGVNILNILHPEVVESLLTQAAGWQTAVFLPLRFLQGQIYGVIVSQRDRCILKTD